MTVVKDLEDVQRSGEELNLDQLLPWLQQHFPSLTDQPKITQFAGGASNWTYRLQFAHQGLILRRAPLGKKAKGAHDMLREFNLQKSLKPHYPMVPKMFVSCEDTSILGSPFYIMERLEGLILRKNLPRQYQWDSAMTQAVCHAFWDKLIELHKVDYQKEGLQNLGKGAGYVKRQISGWNQRYAQAVTWNVPSGKKVMQWLETHCPEDSQLCLIHNDYRLDNVVLDPKQPKKILGVLDWEMATIGDPLMDLGNSLAYWIEAKDDFFIKRMRRQPSHLPGMLTREESIAYYAQKMGIEVHDFSFYRVYGLFRLAGIVQQIYYRYSKGYTQNKAFKNIWMLTTYLVKTCENIIRKS